MSEDETLRNYSTSGLKRNMLSRFEKRRQLASLGIREGRVKEILLELYGEPEATPPVVNK